ncbi:hypothetical protein BS47DRAFT_1287954 [Hydnum rufescens UP504]|uniref:C3H1-type domain-containing protein n=1 Tax=Hydnum rufescens UP504 TaxID=1448309 RepID=A0A9P6E1U8_9AGAM|nr:hypothetical protein BS47DRAFT_1287954 [Hydnum rufescens UP504]
MYAQEAQNALYARYNTGHSPQGGPGGAPVTPGGTATSPYGAPSPYPPPPQQGLVHPGGVGGVAGDPGANGPSANNRKLGLYKTELCRSWEEKGSCRYGPKCQFAHGEEEIRKVARHPKACFIPPYKTEICRTFWVSGSCPYGKRCCFIHTELPAPGAPGNPNPPAPGSTESRAAPNGTGPVTASVTPVSGATSPDGNSPGATHNRSTSTGSDPSDQPSSLLARISAKRGSEVSTRWVPEQKSH